MNKIILIFFLILTIHGYLFDFVLSQPLFKYISEEISSSSGLPHNTVYCIAQDRDGFIWIGTDKGLVRHDGKNFQVFNITNTPALLSNSIISIVNDRTGGLWIATFRGGVIHYKDGKFKPLLFRDKSINDQIWKLYTENNGKLWIGTINLGLISFDHRKFKRHIFPPGKSRSIRDIKKFNDQKIIIGTESGLFLQSETGFEKIVSNQKKDIFAMSVLPDRENGLWIGTNKGLIYGKLTKNRLKILSFSENGNIIRDLKRVNNNIWVASENGLRKIIDGKITSAIFRNDLFYNPLMTVFHDREGIMWVGSAGRGIGKFWNRRIFITGERSGISRVNINSEIIDSSGTLWVGTQGKGLFALKGKTFISVNENSIFNHANIHSLFSNSIGDIWVGSEKGVNLFPKGNINRIINPVPSINASVISIYEDPYKNIILGTRNRGFFVLSKGNYGLKQKKFLKTHSVFSITKGPDDTIWIGTDGGIKIFKNKNFIFSKNIPQLKYDNIFDIFIESGRRVWIAAGNRGFCGIINDKFVEFDNLKRFQGQSFFKIIKDNKGNFWLSTDNGIISVKRRELLKYSEKTTKRIDYSLFGKEEGLFNTVCKGGSQPAGIFSKSGTVFFSTRSGLIYFNPSKWKINRILPLIKINSFSADGKAFNIKKKIELPPKTKKILINISVISHYIPEKVKTYFKLTGSDTLIKGEPEENKIRFTKLPYGKYNLLLTAANSDGIWNYHGKSINFIIAPIFFKRFEFQFFSFSILLLLLFFLPKLHRSIKEKKLKRELKYKKSKLTTVEYHINLQKLRKIVENEKLYLDPNIKLIDISSRMGIPEKILSQIINKALNENFKSFLNGYRIEAAKKNIENSTSKKISLLRIAYRSGFNTKSVFNSTFKKFTGMSPSEYRKFISEKK